MSSTCPNGHSSGTDDYCDQCGARIQAPPVTPPGPPTAETGPGSSAAMVPPGDSTGAAPPAHPCPHCSAPQVMGARFCENCGFDMVSGKPAAAPEPMRLSDFGVGTPPPPPTGAPEFPAPPPSASPEPGTDAPWATSAPSAAEPDPAAGSEPGITPPDSATAGTAHGNDGAHGDDGAHGNDGDDGADGDDGDQGTGRFGAGSEGGPGGIAAREGDGDGAAAQPAGGTHPAGSPSGPAAEPEPAGATGGPTPPPGGSDVWATPTGGTGETRHGDGPEPAMAPGDASELAAPAGRPWKATAKADKAYFDKLDIDGLSFPPVSIERTFELSGQQLVVGRRSVSRGLNPELDFSGEPQDPGISHLHCLLLRQDDGSYSLIDPGSTNGTTVNDSDDLVGNDPVPLNDGDQIHIGAWTTITIHAPEP